MAQLSVHETLENEASEWKRLLTSFKEENIHFKNQLISVLGGETDRQLLDAAEFFQEAFLAQDQALSFLNGEINLYNSLLSSLKHTGDHLSEIERSKNCLRMDMEKESELFKKLKHEFLLYLSENFSGNQTDETDRDEEKTK